MTNTLGLFLLGLRPMELVSHWLCQFWQSLPVSAESAGFGRFCRFRQILPISADTADFGRYCRLYVGINKVSTWYSRFRPTLPISADSADFGRICRFWLTLPILADSVDFGYLCRYWLTVPIYAYLPIPANSSDFGFLRSSVANEAILAVIIACVIHKWEQSLLKFMMWGYRK